MADGSKIEWTDATWNPITGCSVVSPGCTNCYAMRLAGTRLAHHPSRAGLTRESKAGPVWTGEVRLNEQWLGQPLGWRKPRMIFVCAHGDLFAEGVPDEWIDKVFAVMALCPQHTFQVLTKRPERMRGYLAVSGIELRYRWAEAFRPRVMRMSQHEIEARLSPSASTEHRRLYRTEVVRFPLPNVWLGVSVEDQKRADERIPVLLDTPAALRWISAEPLLGAVDLSDYLIPVGLGLRHHSHSGFGVVHPAPQTVRPPLDWVVAGGESGSGARPMHPDWARSLRDQCAVAGVPFLFKQWGAWAHSDQKPPPVPDPSFFDTDGAPFGDGWRFWTQGDRGSDASVRVGKKAAGRLLDGVTHDGFPDVRA